MRVASLGSGSRGNATLVQAGDTTVLIDCGFALRETEARLARLGTAPEQIDAVLLSHEHADHAAGVGALARKYGLPLWVSAGTLRAAAASLGDLPVTRCFCAHTALRIGTLRIEPFAVPHDACEPTQFILTDGRLRLGVVSDAGHVTPLMRRLLGALDALLLEFNHDERMLAEGPYPEPLKKRIAGPYGHLSNAQAAGLLASIDRRRLRYFAALHVSQQNNTPEQVRAAIAAALDGEAIAVAVADQEEGLPWQVIG